MGDKQQDKFLTEFERLAEAQAELRVQRDAMEAPPERPSFEDLEAATRKAEADFASLGAEAEAEIAKVEASRSDFEAPQRDFSLERGVSRPPKKPNHIKTAIVVQGTMVAETAGTATFLLGDGAMGMVLAFLTAFVFSATNIASGLAIGYFGLRWAVHGASGSTLKNRAKRWAAGALSGFGITAMIGMHLAAARVRATGGHADIWNFEQASLGATFGDYYALALLALGLLAGLVALREGYGQLSDPIPGYSEIAQECESSFKAKLDEAFDAQTESLDAALDQALDTIEAPIAAYDEALDAYNNDAQSLRERALRHNSDVEVTIMRLDADGHDEEKRRQYKVGPDRDIDPVVFDLKALRKLAVDEKRLPESLGSAPDTGALSLRIEAAHNEALGRLEAAYRASNFFFVLPFFDGRRAKQENA